ncbi:CARDB domain-containing protein [Marivirga tractuosa]|uniref:CARDB domain-containing protein n=1 Tax=Marivirga tractuosa TaxID=1006 RepID=UPI0035CF2F18
MPIELFFVVLNLGFLQFIMRKLILLPILIFLLAFPAFSQDLIIESMTIEASYHKHSAFTYSVSIKNIGVISSSKGVLKIYFGNDASDYSSFFTSDYFPALDADETVTMQFEIGGSEYLDDLDKEVGSYYVNVIIDPNAYNFIDVNPSNNKYQAGVTEVTASTADILLNNFSLNNASNHVQGKELALNVDASNPGSTIRGVYVEAYLSDDMVFDEEDLQLERAEYLRFDYQNELTDFLLNDFEIPFNITPGEYYVFLKVDSYDIIQEIDEANNVYQAGNIEVASSNASLIIPEHFVDFQWTEYGVSISFEIENTGSTDVTYLDYYVSSYSGGMGYNTINYYGQGIKAGESTSEYVNIEEYEIHGNYIYIGNNDPKYPYISEVEIYIGSKPTYNYNFNISDVYLDSPVETEDTEIPITIEIENPNENSIYESATIDITLESLDGQITENYSVRKGIYMYEYGTDELNLSLPNRPSVTAGIYNVTTNINLDNKDGSAGPFISEIEIIASEYNIEVEIVGQNGDIINEGIVYFYEKTPDGAINFISSKNIEENNGVGTVSFQQSAGNYMFFVVPDKNEFPNYIRTVSGNTFKLEETSFTEIYSDATIQIEPIYVDPNALSGSKIIEGNVVAGTATGRMTYSQTASASFDETPVYLTQENSVVAFTYTDASGAFSFSNVENGDYDVYFDDGDILASNDITANVNVDESTDIVNLTIDENGEVDIQDLKMEIAAFDLETRDMEADEDNLSIQYRLSNFYKHNSIAISDAFFYCYIKQNDVILDSLAFEKNLALNENDTLNIKNSLHLTSLLDIGEYEVELYFSTPYQNTEVPGSARTFNVIEPHYNIKAFALDSQQSPVTSGVIQLYKINGSGQAVLFEEKTVSQDGSASFYTPTCDYVIRVVPQKESYPHLIPSFQNQKYYFSDDDIQTLTTDTEHQINLVNDPSQVLNGNRKVLFNFDDDNFSFNETRVIIANAADSSVIRTSYTEDNHFEIKNFESGEYLFFFDDEDITIDHEKWYSLVINEQDDLYQMEINSSSTSLNQYDYDFMVKKDSVFTYYNKMSQLNMAFDIDKYSSVFPDELVSFDFRIDLISKESTDSLSFFYSEMLDFNTFEDLDKTLLLDSFLDAGMYDVKVNYSSQYTNGFVQSNAFPIEILDAGINLNKVQLEQELLENALQIPLKFQLIGSNDRLADFKVYYEHKLIKGTDTITIQNHQNSIDIGNEESKTYSYTLNLDTNLELGDYKLITYFSPYHHNKSNQQLVETTFRVKNKGLSINNLSLNDELSVISDSMNFSFSISANNEDSIKNQNIKLISYLIKENDTLIHKEEGFTLNIPRSGTEEFQMSIDLKDKLTSDLNPGDYKLVVELKHPIDIYSKKSAINFRVNDPSIELLEIIIPKEISSNTNEIDCEIKVSGNNHDIIRLLQTDFKLSLLKKDKILSDTIITKDLTIQKSGSISINIPLSFASTLEDGEYLFELSYITKYMSNYSATISDDFTVFTESEITSNKEELIPEYNIYPNPFGNHISIIGDFDDAILYNQYGKLIKAYHEETGFQNLGDISAGVYLLVIEYQGKMVYKKVIKK